MMATTELPVPQHSDTRENIAGLHMRRFELQDLCHRAIGLPVYVSFSDELQLQVDGTGDWLACVVPGLDRLIERSLPEVYDGPRQSMCLNADFLNRIPSKAGREQWILGLILHEIAHLVESEFRGTRFTPPIPERVQEILEARQGEYSETETFSNMVAPWQGHGVEYCRLLIHIYAAFLRAGMVEVNDCIAWPHELFGLAPLHRYRKLLRLELSKCPTVAQIVNSAPPAKFAAAFAEDEAFFWHRMKREAARCEAV